MYGICWWWLLSIQTPMGGAESLEGGSGSGRGQSPSPRAHGGLGGHSAWAHASQDSDPDEGHRAAGTIETAPLVCVGCGGGGCRGSSGQLDRDVSRPIPASPCLWSRLPAFRVLAPLMSLVL